MNKSSFMYSLTALLLSLAALLSVMSTQENPSFLTSEFEQSDAQEQEDSTPSSILTKEEVSEITDQDPNPRLRRHHFYVPDWAKEVEVKDFNGMGHWGTWRMEGEQPLTDPFETPDSMREIRGTAVFPRYPQATSLRLSSFRLSKRPEVVFR